MSELAAWLRAKQLRGASRPDLVSALLSGRGFAYAWHRLGLMALRMALRTGVHGIEVYLLTLAFVPFEYVAPLITYRAVSVLLGAAHWGSLEALRQRVRAAMTRRQRSGARAQIERWLGLTRWTVIALVLATLALELRSAWISSQLELRDAYALACVVRFGLESTTRVVHSGVFALRRVYRPTASLLAGDLVELGTIALGFERLGVWAIPLATLLGGLTDGITTQWYVRRAYRQRRLEWPRFWRSLAAVSRLRPAELAEAARHALANATLQLDALVLLLLLHAPSGRADGGSFALLYYVLRPLLTATTSWVRTFYFDLKRIEASALRALRPRLLQYLERLALGWAALLALATIVGAQLLFRGQLGSELLWLVPFFVVRSLLALWQTVAFGAGQYRSLSHIAAAVLAGLALLVGLSRLGLRDSMLLAALTVFLGVLVAWARRHPLALSALEPRTALDRAAWLAQLRAASSVQLVSAKRSPRSVSQPALVESLRRVLPDSLATEWGPHSVLLFSRSPVLLAMSELVIASAGTLVGLWASSPCAPVEALRRARAAGVLPEGLLHVLCGASAPDPGLLERQFRARYSGGVICDLARSRGMLGLSTRPVSAATMHTLVHCIQARSRGREARAERRLPFQIAVYAPAGQASLVFIADKGATDFATFRASVHRASLQASWPDALSDAYDPALGRSSAS